MASKLPHPSSSEDFRKFRDRIRQKPPTSPVDAKWLVTNVGISQESNARALLSALKGAGFLDEDGMVSSTGNQLRGSEDSEGYKNAMVDAYTRILSEDCVASIRAGTVTSANILRRLAVQTGSGESMVRKALLGVKWLAEEAGDTAIVDAVTLRKQNTAQSRPAASKLGSTKKQEPKPPTIVTPTPQDEVSVDPLQRVPSLTEPIHTPPLLNGDLLTSGALKVVIDSGWNLEDARELIRMMQQVERGELV